MHRIDRFLCCTIAILGCSVPCGTGARADAPDPRGSSGSLVAGPAPYAAPSLPQSPAVGLVSSGYRSLHMAASIGGLSLPFHLTAAGDLVFESDIGSNQVRVYQIVAGGFQFLRAIGAAGSGAGQFSGPEQSALVGNDLYVADFNNNRVQRFNATTGVFLSQFGTTGSGAGQFNTPAGLVYSPVSGLLYVSEVGNDRVQMFTPSGSYVGQFGSLGTGNGQFNNPFALAVDARGNIYVADNVNNRVVKFTAAGAFVRNLAVGVAAPLGVTIDGANLLWVTSGAGDLYAYESLGNYVAYYYGAAPAGGWSEGYFQSVRGLAATGPLPFAPYNGRSALLAADIASNTVQAFVRSSQPTAHPAQGSLAGLGGFNGQVAFDRAQNVYITSNIANVVYKYDRFGALITQWGSAGSGNGQFNGAYGIALDDSDNVYVVDRGNNRIQKFNSGGMYLLQWGSAGSGAGLFNGPSNLACDGSWIYVTDELNHRVQKFSFSGTYVRQWGSLGSGNGQFNVPAGIAVDRNRNSVYVGEFSGNRVQQFSVFGDFVKILADSVGGTGALSGPRGLTTDQHGNLYVADGGNARVVHYNGNGTYLDNFAVPGANGIGISARNATLYVGTLTGGTVARFGSVTGKVDTIGVYRPAIGAFLLRRSNTAGAAEIAATVAASEPQDLPLTGDWNGDGIDTPGLYRPATSTVYLWDRWTNLGIAAPDYSFALGTTGDRPVVGDWDGDGSDELGWYRPSTATHYLRSTLDAGAADFTAVLGTIGDLGLAGDWDLDGSATPGVYRASDARFHVSNRLASGSLFEDGAYPLGQSGDRPVVGDWTQRAYSALGVFRPSAATFFLKYNLDNSAFDTSVVFQPDDPALLFRDSFETPGATASGDLPLGGNWGSVPE